MTESEGATIATVRRRQVAAFYNQQGAYLYHAAREGRPNARRSTSSRGNEIQAALEENAHVVVNDVGAMALKAVPSAAQRHRPAPRRTNART